MYNPTKMALFFCSSLMITASVFGFIDYHAAKQSQLFSHLYQPPQQKPPPPPPPPRVIKKSTQVSQPTRGVKKLPPPPSRKFQSKKNSKPLSVRSFSRGDIEIVNKDETVKDE
jgi:hypothetical protein